MIRFRHALLAPLAAALLAAAPARAQDAVLNLYSARHYQTDEALYANFTKATGIRINRIEAGDEQLLERLRSEGANSPADVLLIVDASRLYGAQQLGLFQPVRSPVLESRIPPALRDPNGEWFGFSQRARVIVYSKARVKPADVPTYESLADPANKGKVCVRSGSHPYNLSLVAAMIEHLGEPKAEAWARSLVANFARAPKGGDTDQIKAVRPASATSRSRTPTTTRGSSARRSPTSRSSSRRPASCGPTRRASARTSTSRAPAS